MNTVSLRTFFLTLTLTVLLACGGGGSSSGGSNNSGSGGPTIRNFMLEMTATPLTVLATADVADSDGGLDNVQLNWGDGTIEQLGARSRVNKTHVYMAAGRYTVTITASDDKRRSTSQMLTITVTQ